MLQTNKEVEKGLTRQAPVGAIEEAAQEGLEKLSAITEAEMLGNAVDKMPVDLHVLGLQL